MAVSQSDAVPVTSAGANHMHPPNFHPVYYTSAWAANGRPYPIHIFHPHRREPKRVNLLPFLRDRDCIKNGNSASTESLSKITRASTRCQPAFTPSRHPTTNRLSPTPETVVSSVIIYYVPPRHRWSLDVALSGLPPDAPPDF